MLALRLPRFVHDIAALHLAQFRLIRAPQFDEGSGFHRCGAVGGDVDGGMIGVHPEPNRGLRIADCHLIRGTRVTHRDLDAAFAQLQLLAIRLARRDRIRLKMDAHFADLDQPGVVIPSVRLADVELEVAVLRHPSVERDVPIAQRHRAVVIHARGVPNHVERVGSSGDRCERDQRGEADKGQQTSDNHSCSSNSPSWIG